MASKGCVEREGGAEEVAREVECGRKIVLTDVRRGWRRGVEER
jgi:hypothetical protein